MGTSIKDRHTFFRTHDEELAEDLKKILKSSDLTEPQKYEKLLQELNTMWTHKIEQFVDTDLMQFELDIPFERFTCVIIGSKDQLWREVLEYFYEMLDIRESKPVKHYEEVVESVVQQM